MFYSILQHRERDQSIQNDADAELEAAREADSFSFGPRHKLTNTRGSAMKTEDLQNLVNQYRRRLQEDTANVGDGITVCAYLLLSFCMDGEEHNIDHANARLKMIAALLLDDAKRIGFVITREH